MPLLVLANCEGGEGIKTARQVLESGGTALDAVEQAVRVVEADPNVTSVGRGGDPNLLGEMECDAAVMDGATLRAGAVGALRGYLYPVSVARQVLERLPHLLLVGDGAARFAREIGAETAELLTEEARRRHDDWLKQRVSPADLARWPDVPLAPYAWESGKDYVSGGTTAFIAVDSENSVAVATSTSGWSRCYPGRVGDTPVIGAGLYADNRFGACACTHTGEMAMRTATARSVVQYMKQGMSVSEACFEALADLQQLRMGVIGALVIHALDFYGNPCVVSTEDLGRASSYFLWRDGGDVQQLPADTPPTA